MKRRPTRRLPTRSLADDASPLAADPAIAVSIPSDATDVVLTVPADERDVAFATLEGSVVDAETGRPVFPFEAHLLREREDLEAKRLSAGRFRFEDVPDGSYRLRVTAFEHVAHESRIVVDATSASSPLEIRLERGATVRGTIRAPGDVDLAYRTLCLRSVERNRRCNAGYVSQDGSFRVTGLLPGRYRVQLESFSAFAEEAFLAPARVLFVDVPSGSGEQVLDLELRPAGLVQLVLRRPPGRASATSDPAVRFQIRDASGLVVLTVHGSASEFVYWFTDLVLAPGSYEASLAIGDSPPTQRSIEVVAGTRKWETFDLQ